MSDNDNRASKERQDFLDTFDDVDKFLYASESIEEELNRKPSEIDITTDLGSSGSVINLSSPMPLHGSPMDRSDTRVQPERPNTTLEDRISVSSATPTLPLQSDTPLPLADTSKPSSENQDDSPNDTYTDEHTTQQQSDSLNTNDLKRMAGMSSTEFKREVSIVGSKFSPAKSNPKIEFEYESTENNDNIENISNVASPIKDPSLLDIKGTNLLDKVSFMESSAPNTLLATGASIADLPLEEVVAVKTLEQPQNIIREETPDDLSSVGKSDIRGSVGEEVQKILDEVKSSERGYSSDQFESESEDAGLSHREDPVLSSQELAGGRIFSTEYEVKSPERPLSTHSKTIVNPFESTPINSEYLAQDKSAGFDVSPVKKETQNTALTVALIDDQTSSNELSQEKDMAYYLAKIKAKAAQKSLELRSSKENSSASDSKSDKSPEFLKPKTPAPKKRLGPVRPASGAKRSIPVKISGHSTTKSKVPVRSQTAVRQTRVAQSPVAAYIRGENQPPATAAAAFGSGKSSNADRDTSRQNLGVGMNEKNLGDTWTSDMADKSLVEVIQSNGDVEAWKELYKRTQQELKQVQDQMSETERLHAALISALKASHSQELLKYEQEVYLLQSKVKSAGLAGGGGGGDGDSRVEQLSKQLSELEKLLTGSQAENMKLYEEMRKMKDTQKEEVTRLYLENKDLATNNVAIKQLLEQKDATIRQLQQKQQSLALQDKIATLPKLVALQEELDACKQREYSYKQRLAIAESAPREFNDAAVNSSLIQVEQQITTLVKEHNDEREELYRKLDTLLQENTRLRTDSEILKSREERITELQKTIKTLQSPEHQSQLVSLATAESNRTISDLKRQVAELEKALHKRHPDSIAALIAAAQPADYSSKIQEMQEQLVKVKAEYEEQLAYLERKRTPAPVPEQEKVHELNHVLNEKVSRMEEINAQMYEKNVQLEQENKDLKDGNVPTGQVRKKMEQLQDKLKIQSEEITELKSKLAHHHPPATAPPAKQYNPEQFEGLDASEIKRENTYLKTKCDLLKIDNEQQKSTLVGFKVTHETEVMRLSEDHALKVDKLIQHHEEERQKLVSEHASRYSESEVAKLKSKVETLQLQVSHYSDQAAKLPALQGEVHSMRSKESTLVEQITKLGRELEEATAQQPPTVHQYKVIQQKLENMEVSHKSEIDRLQHVIDSYEKDKVRVVIADEHVIRKYREMLVEKNLQIEKFQMEIDSIISLCMELQGHGIILPNMNKLRS